MSDINILVLSCGRRVELINLFKKALISEGTEGNIIAADCSELAPAAYFADKFFKLPRVNDNEYINRLIEVSNNNNVSLIVPTIDTELIILAENKEEIERKTQAKVLISDLNVINICRDKINTHEFLNKNDFSTPKKYELNECKNEAVYPLFIKPKSGSSSINTYKVSNYSDLESYYKNIEGPIIQEFIEGKEYTVDAFTDFASNVITIVPRERLATRSGEILKGKIVRDKEIIEDVRNLVTKLKPIGHITIQLMKTKDGIKYIEINPRFGGGAPMSIMSGADSCRALIKLLKGETLSYSEDYKDNLIYLRYDQSICIDENYQRID